MDDLEPQDSTARDRVLHGLLTVMGAAVATAVVFFVLPVLQAITAREAPTLDPPTVDAPDIDPPEIEEEEPPEEEEPEEEPEPEIDNEPLLLDLEQLDMALNAGFGDGFGGGTPVNLAGLGLGGDGDGGGFDFGDVDQKARPTHQPQPISTAQTRRDAPGTCTVIFIVDERGRVQDERVVATESPAFNRPALAAVRQWRFEPAMRNGEPTRDRVRVHIKFPES